MSLRKSFKSLIILALLAPVFAGAQTPTDGNGWFQLAVESRQNDQFSEAYDALKKAERLGFAPVRISFERARLHTLANETDEAVAEIESIADEAASTVGKITCGEKLIAEVDLMFSHVDQNLAGKKFPEENFVFTDLFGLVLRDFGIEVPKAGPNK